MALLERHDPAPEEDFRMWSSIPLFAFILLAYNVLVFAFQGTVGGTFLQVRLPSQAEWSFGVNDLLLAVALVFLYVEILRATGTATHSIMNHVLSLVVFVICLIEFIIFPAFGNSTFFLITLMALIDVIAGFTVTISSARRDVDFRH